MTASKRKMLYLQKNYTPKYQFKHIPTNMMTEIFVIGGMIVIIIVVIIVKLGFIS
jgi:hypothetical protein